jgi:hypothetical protein
VERLSSPDTSALRDKPFADAVQSLQVKLLDSRLCVRD